MVIKTVMLTDWW